MAEFGYRTEPAKVVPLSNVMDLTLSLDTSAYTSGDVLAAPQELTDVFRLPGGRVRLMSVVVLDEDDQGQNLDLVFMNADGSLGAENATLGPTDAVARTIIGIVSVTNWVDLANSQLATEGAANAALPLMLEGAAAATSLWVAAVCREGTPTYSAAGIRLKLAFEQY